MADTAIEWADRVLNPVTGCDRVSPGCDHCYALTMAKRLKGMGSAKYQTDGDPKTSGPGFGVALHPDTLTDVLRWRKPQRVFVNSMSDLFHDKVPDDYIANVWAVMARANQHTFQILTKRHARMRSLLNSDLFHRRVYDYLVSIDYAWISATPVVWPLRNVWLCVSAENQQWADIRIPALLQTPAAVRGVSIEPMLSRIDMSRYLRPRRCSQCGQPWTASACGPTHAVLAADPGLHWIIVGGESGHGARPMNPNWVRSVRDQCVNSGTAFFFKQYGAWAPAPWKLERRTDEFTLDYKARSEAAGATHAFTGGMYHDDSGALVEHFMKLDHAPWSAERDTQTPPGAQGMHLVSKKNAGRQLDGREWSEYPETAAV